MADRNNSTEIDSPVSPSDEQLLIRLQCHDGTALAPLARRHADAFLRNALGRGLPADHAIQSVNFTLFRLAASAQLFDATRDTGEQWISQVNEDAVFQTIVRTASRELQKTQGSELQYKARSPEETERIFQDIIRKSNGDIIAASNRKEVVKPLADILESNDDQIIHDGNRVYNYSSLLLQNSMERMRDESADNERQAYVSRIAELERHIEAVTAKLARYEGDEKDRKREAELARRLEASHGVKFQRLPASAYPGKPLVSAEDAAKVSGWTQPYISELGATGTIPVLKIGRQRFLDPQAVEALLARPRRGRTKKP